MADLDGDGIEDIVIPARCTNPMMDQAENSFVVVDPYNSFFGYGNPKVTTQFASEDPDRRGYSLLVIHGAGPSLALRHSQGKVPHCESAFQAGHREENGHQEKEADHGNLHRRNRRRSDDLGDLLGRQEIPIPAHSAPAWNNRDLNHVGTGVLGGPVERMLRHL